MPQILTLPQLLISTGYEQSLKTPSARISSHQVLDWNARGSLKVSRAGGTGSLRSWLPMGANPTRSDVSIRAPIMRTDWTWHNNILDRSTEDISVGFVQNFVYVEALYPQTGIEIIPTQISSLVEFSRALYACKCTFSEPFSKMCSYRIR